MAQSRRVIIEVFIATGADGSQEWYTPGDPKCGDDGDTVSTVRYVFDGPTLPELREYLRTAEDEPGDDGTVSDAVNRLIVTGHLSVEYPLHSDCYRRVEFADLLPQLAADLIRRFCYHELDFYENRGVGIVPPPAGSEPALAAV